MEIANKYNMLAEKAKALMAGTAMTAGPVDIPGLSDSPANEPGRVHDEPVRGPMSAVERINAVLDEIEAARTRKGEAARVMQDVIDTADRDIVLRAYEVGTMLIEEKAKLKADKGGKWSKWIEDNFRRPGGEPLSQNTAIDYMLLAEWRDRIEAFSQQHGGAVISSIRRAKEVVKALKTEDGRNKKLDEEEKQNKLGEQDNTETEADGSDTGQGEDDIDDDIHGDIDDDDDEPEGPPVELPLDAYERVFRGRDADRFVLLVRNFDWEPEYMRAVARHMLRVATALEETKKLKALRKARSASARGFVRVGPTAH